MGTHYGNLWPQHWESLHVSWKATNIKRLAKQESGESIPEGLCANWGQEQIWWVGTAPPEKTKQYKTAKRMGCCPGCWCFSWPFLHSTLYSVLPSLGSLTASMGYFKSNSPFSLKWIWSELLFFSPKRIMTLLYPATAHHRICGKWATRCRTKKENRYPAAAKPFQSKKMRELTKFQCEIAPRRNQASGRKKDTFHFFFFHLWPQNPS